MGIKIEEYLVPQVCIISSLIITVYTSELFEYVYLNKSL